MPKAIKFTSTDENRDLSFGDEEAEIKISGESKNLSSLLSGSTVLIGEVLAGRIRIHGSLHHLTVLSEATLKMSRELFLLNNPREGVIGILSQDPPDDSLEFRVLYVG